MIQAPPLLGLRSACHEQPTGVFFILGCLDVGGKLIRALLTSTYLVELKTLASITAAVSWFFMYAAVGLYYIFTQIYLKAESYRVVLQLGCCDVLLQLCCWTAADNQKWLPEWVSRHWSQRTSPSADKVFTVVRIILLVQPSSINGDVGIEWCRKNVRS